jgi:hypothetical protein
MLPYLAVVLSLGAPLPCGNRPCTPPSSAKEAMARVRFGPRPIAMATPSHLLDSWWAVGQVASLPGDIVEVGVYKGGATMVMAWSEMRAAQRSGRPLNRTMFLFDTFEGLPQPDARDGERALARWRSISRGGNRTDLFRKGAGYIDAHGVKRWNYGPLDLVAANVKSTGYPPDKLRFVKGRVEETLTVRANVPREISVLRLDTDFYSSTRKELEVLLPCLVPGGVLMVDDYCTWGGARAAVDEFIAAHPSVLVDVVKTGSHCFRAKKAKYGGALVASP